MKLILSLLTAIVLTGCGTMGEYSCASKIRCSDNHYAWESPKPVQQPVIKTLDSNPPKGYNVAGKTAFESCLNATQVKEVQGALEAVGKLFLSPITAIGCTAAGTGEVVANFSNDNEENIIRWKEASQRTDAEKQRLAELIKLRGERGLHGYGGWAGNQVESYGTVYTPSGGYQVTRNGNQIFVDQVSKSK